MRIGIDVAPSETEAGPRVMAVALLSMAVTLGCGGGAGPTLRVELGTRGLSKLPFVIAEDQGLYEKYGLDVELRMPPPEFDGGIETHSLLWGRLGFSRRFHPHIVVDGATPMIVDTTTNAKAPRQIVLASTDCVVRMHVVGREGLSSLEELRGKRLGTTAHIRTTTSFTALLLAQRMGWDPVHDISILRNGRDVEALKSGIVDAIVANEREYAAALGEGLPILADTREWNAPIAGNSVRVEQAWLSRPENRELALRFLKATVEGTALFHTRRELALDVLRRWHGMQDAEFAEAVYERGATLPRKPYPCYDGIAKTMELYDSNEMRRYTAKDFYDDSLLRELDESGFIDGFYE